MFGFGIEQHWELGCPQFSGMRFQHNSEKCSDKRLGQWSENKDMARRVGFGERHLVREHTDGEC